MSFWTYLIAALQTVVPGIGASALSLLQEPQPPPIETVLAPLLNELGAVSTDIVLVLDDEHMVDARDIHGGMAFLLEHLPPRIHLVIATRADPALPLARLRGRGELVEIRAADLRFTPDEAAAYLNEVMGLDLAATDIAALEGRTEGWIAALQLAALSMQGRDDIAGLHRGVRRGRPLHRRLPGRGGPAAAARTCPPLPAADLHPEPAERPTVRCRHRPGRRQDQCWRRSNEGTCSWSRSTTDVAGIAITISSPTCCERTCWTSSPICVPGAAPAGERVVRTERRAVRGHPPRPGRRRLRASSRPDGACDPDDARVGRKPRCVAGSGHFPTSSSDGACPERRLRRVLIAGGELEGVEQRLHEAERWLDDDDRRRADPASGRRGWSWRVVMSSCSYR